MKVTCNCGTEFEARDRRARYCSDRCRKRAQRGGEVVEFRPPTPDTPSAAGPIEVATTAELVNAERLDTAMGQTCLALARRLDLPGVDTGSAIASVAARLEDLLTKATKGAGVATSPQQLRDELAQRRTKRA